MKTKNFEIYFVFLPFVVMYIYIYFMNKSLLILMIEIVILILAVILYVFALLYKNIKNTKLMEIIGFGLLFSSLSSFLHALYLEDIDIMLSSGLERGTQFLFISSLMFVLTFLISFLKLNNKLKHNHIIIIITIVFNLLISLVFLGFVPTLYSDISGYTVTKIYTDYFIILLLFLVIILLLINRDKYEEVVFKHQLASFILYIIAEVMIIISSDEYTTLAIFAFILRFFAYVVLVRGFIGELLVKRIKDDYEDLSDTIHKLREEVGETSRNENIFKSLYDDAPLGYQSLDINGNFLYVNETYAKMLGYRKDEMLGQYFGDFLDKEDSKLFPKRFSYFKSHGKADVIFSMMHKKGYLIPVRFIGKIAIKEKGEFKQTHCILMDISNEVEYQKGIVESKTKLEQFMSDLELSIYIVNADLVCTYVNQKLINETGYTKDELEGVIIHDVLHHSYANGDTYPLEDCISYKALKSKKPFMNIKEVIWSKNHAILPVLMSTELIIENGKATGVIVMMRNEDQAHNLSQSLIMMSYHDTLTGIFNRRYYQEEIKSIDNLTNLPISVISCDINGLKLINDAFGHVEGDTLLKNAVEVFTKFASNKDLIARIGGDEFVIIMTKTDKKTAQERITLMKEEAKKYTIHSIELSVSYGLATKTNIKQDYEDIYIQAEDLMYRDKLINVPSMRTTAIETIIKNLNESDPTIKLHSQNTSVISMFIATKMGYNAEFVTEIRMAGLLHDIGKIILNKDLLTKDGSLSVEEYEEIKKHSEIGFRILNSSTQVRVLSPYVLSHHEHYDGSGYPQGIKGNKIPVQSRILAVAEAIEVMLNKETSYQKVKTKEELILELERCKGTQFDPAIVEIVLDNIDEIESMI